MPVDPPSIQARNKYQNGTLGMATMHKSNGKTGTPTLKSHTTVLWTTRNSMLANGYEKFEMCTPSGRWHQRPTICQHGPDGKDKPWMRYTCKKETKNIIYKLGNSW